MREYRIHIEADSMAALDWAAERDAAVQFMQGLGAFVSQVAPMAQQVPGAAPVLLSMLQWAVSKFRVSTQIESVLDQAITGLKQQGLQPPGPSPMQQAEVAEKQAGAKERMAKAANSEMDARMKAVEMSMIQPQGGLPAAMPAMPATPPAVQQ
jgi:hypothetical protein